ncbi:MAG: HD family hydrolase [Spirochaetales bacterium]|nr:HD family hydrolase [Spirochaetales bacterium]
MQQNSPDPFILTPSNPGATFEENVIGLFASIHPLDLVPRAGWLLRGVPRPESVAAHSHFLSLLTLLFIDRYPGKFNRDKALTLALIHDLPEAFLMDIPMPVSDRHLGEAKKEAETSLTAALFDGFAPRYLECFRELEARETPEAKLVAGLDKAQMMLKVVGYEKSHWGNLEEFWENPANFRDDGVQEVSALFDAVCAAAGRKRPKG